MKKKVLPIYRSYFVWGVIGNMICVFFSPKRMQKFLKRKNIISDQDYEIESESCLSNYDNHNNIYVLLMYKIIFTQKYLF